MDLRTAALERLERPAPPAAPEHQLSAATEHAQDTEVEQRDRISVLSVSSVAKDVNTVLAETISCPWCESTRVERVGVIGSHLMVSQYICLACRSPFEVIRR